MKISEILVASNSAAHSGLIRVGKSGHPDEVAGKTYWGTILAERGKLFPTRRCLDLERGEAKARRVKSAPKVSAADLHNWKLLAAFRERMEPLLAQAPVTATEADPRRTLHMGDYFAMVLFAMLNPVIATTRSLCASSSLERMQAEVCGGPVSLGSFSEMQAVADPELLAGLLRELGDMALPRS